jgi:pimeloyl-ACP methyl ester carboxylesterase
MPGRFAAGVSIVGAAKLAKLVLASSITADIQADLLEMGYDEAKLEPILRPVEATACAADVRDLLMFGGEDDVIVPGALVRETFDAFTDDTNELVMFDGCGHFPPLTLVADYALPFLARRF